MHEPGIHSAWAPLRIRVFRWLWIAGVASNVGTWMHEVGAGWLMASLNPDPFWVSLVQAASTLPFLLLALPAGALADVLDRRKILLGSQLAMLLLAACLALTTAGGLTTPAVLLIVTLGIGAATSLSNPAWQTVMTELVPREQLPQASALNSVSLNLSRAVGPAVGGLIVSMFGPAAAFALNAVSFVGIVLVLALWRYERRAAAAPGERFLGAIRAGARYIRRSAPMHAVLVRTASFVLFASCLWALMPLIAKEQIKAGASGYGLLMGSLGIGAVITVAILPRLRSRLSPNRLLLSAAVVYAPVLAAFAFVREPILAYALMLPAGAAWVVSVVCLNVAAQSGTPPWVRARSLACYLAVFFGSMAVGSPVWGLLAGRIGIPFTMLVAAAGMIIALATMIRWRLVELPKDELESAGSWEDPVVSRDISPADGPVVVTIEYRVAAENAEDFAAAMAPVATTRYRDGAISWTLSRCTENPARWLEVFMVESWAEHLRQHTRVTRADQKVQEFAKSFHMGPQKPVVSHFIAAPVRPTPVGGDQTLVVRDGE